MEEQDTGCESGSAPHPQSGEGGLFGPPHRKVRLQVAVAAQGLVVAASVAVPALTRVEPFPGQTLFFFGLMVATAAELLDPELYRYVVGQRLVGWAIALFGVALLFL